MVMRYCQSGIGNSSHLFYKIHGTNFNVSSLDKHVILQKYAFDMRARFDHKNELMLRIMLQTGAFTGDFEHEDMVCMIIIFVISLI